MFKVHPSIRHCPKHVHVRYARISKYKPSAHEKYGQPSEQVKKLQTKGSDFKNPSGDRQFPVNKRNKRKAGPGNYHKDYSPKIPDVSDGTSANQPKQRWTWRRDPLAVIGRFKPTYPFPDALRDAFNDFKNTVTVNNYLKSDVFALNKHLLLDHEKYDGATMENSTRKQITAAIKKRTFELTQTGLSKGKAQSRAYDELKQSRLSTYLRENELYLHRKRGAVNYGKRESLAFLFGRFPGIYASTARILTELKMRYPAFSPEKVMDFGSGVGASLWATTNVFPDAESFRAIEVSHEMNNIHAALATGESKHHMTKVSMRRQLHQPRSPTYDLVIASYTLSEILEQQNLDMTVDMLCGHTKGFLVLVETGNQTGFQTMTYLRSYILKNKPNMELVAPCPHTQTCPMVQRGQVCKFLQSAEFSSGTVLHRRVMGRGHLTEQYSYLVFRNKDTPMDNRFDFMNDWSRILTKPLRRSSKVIVDACTSLGTRERIIASKRVGIRNYRNVRSRKMGDLYPPDNFTIGSKLGTDNYAEFANDENFEFDFEDEDLTDDEFQGDIDDEVDEFEMSEIDMATFDDEAFIEDRKKFRQEIVKDPHYVKMMGSLLTPDDLAHVAPPAKDDTKNDPDQKLTEKDEKCD